MIRRSFDKCGITSKDQLHSTLKQLIESPLFDENIIETDGEENNDTFWVNDNDYEDSELDEDEDDSDEDSELDEDEDDSDEDSELDEDEGESDEESEDANDGFESDESDMLYMLADNGAYVEECSDENRVEIEMDE